VEAAGEEGREDGVAVLATLSWMGEATMPGWMMLRGGREGGKEGGSREESER